MKPRVPKLAWDFISEQEGNPLKAYWDVDRWRIGRAIAGPDINQNTVWTAEQSDNAFEAQLQEMVTDICPHIQPELSDPQLAACLSLTYNIGVPAFLESTLLKDINSGDYQGAANEFPRWCHSAGKVDDVLLVRRNKEKALFLSGVQPVQMPIAETKPLVDNQATAGGKVNPIATVKNSRALTKTLMSLVAVAVAALQDPTVQATIAGLVKGHKGLSAVVIGIGAIAALLHQPEPKQ